MRKLAFALLLAAGCSSVASGGSDGGAADASVRVATRAMMLDPGDPARRSVGRLDFRGAVEISGGGIGGLSGLALRDGGRFAAVSDRGSVVFGTLRHDAEGWLTGVDGLETRRLPRPGGPADAEDIQRLSGDAWPGGGWLVAFERDHRIVRYPPGLGRDDGAAVPKRLPPPPGLDAAPRNGGIEAMAPLADGRLLILEEGADDGVAARRAWIAAPRLRGPGDWRALTYRAAPGFRPTGAALAPSGDLIVLERAVSLFGGWQIRVVRVAAGAWDRGSVLEGEALATLGLPLLVDNFEGIAATPGPHGETMIYLVSDDNFSPLQRTVLALFALPPQGP